MVHQCLKCGKVFPNGSPSILKGCSGCGGKKFFYAVRPIPKEDREKLTVTTTKDMDEVIRDIFVKEKINRKELKDIIKQINAKGEWAEIKRAEIPKTIEKDEEVVVAIEKTIKGVKKVKPEYLKQQKKTLKKNIENEDKGPEVVDVLDFGVYDIDVESLLEKSPIVVKRDGSYMIHLPSLFESLNKKTERNK